MAPARDPSTSTRSALRLLALATVALAAMCVFLALAWRDKAQEAACFRQALSVDETPAVADSDCL